MFHCRRACVSCRLSIFLCFRSIVLASLSKRAFSRNGSRLASTPSVMKFANIVAMKAAKYAVQRICAWVRVCGAPLSKRVISSQHKQNLSFHPSTVIEWCFFLSATSRFREIPGSIVFHRILCLGESLNSLAEPTCPWKKKNNPSAASSQSKFYRQMLHVEPSMHLSILCRHRSKPSYVHQPPNPPPRVSISPFGWSFPETK